MEKIRHIIINNFWNVGFNGDKSVAKEELGWSDAIKEDAKSDNPETIFRYVVEIVGFNILFYWIKDGNWYTIETEKDPIEVRKIFPNPKWDGKCEYLKAGLEGYPQTSSQGELLATFNEPIQIWKGLKICGFPIGEILENSVIATLD